MVALNLGSVSARTRANLFGDSHTPQSYLQEGPQTSKILAVPLRKSRRSGPESASPPMSISSSPTSSMSWYQSKMSLYRLSDERALSTSKTGCPSSGGG